jgi:hypothetical protein
MFLVCLALISIKLLSGCISGKGGDNFGTSSWTPVPISTTTVVTENGNLGVITGKIYGQEIKTETSSGASTKRVVPSPVLSATIVVLDSANRELPTSTTFSGNGGDFAIKLSPGSYSVKVTKSGFEDYKTAIFSVGAGEQVALNNINLQLAFSLEGTVKINNTNKDTLTEGTAQLAKAAAPQTILVTTSLSADGRFLFTGKPSGSYLLTIVPKSDIYKSASYTLIITETGDFIPSSKEFLIDFNPSKSLKSISGKIRDAFTKAPLEFVNCAVKGFNSTLSDAQGNYAFLLPEGEFQVVFSKAGFADLSTNFAVSNAGVVSPILDFGLTYNQEKELGTISGRYIDETSADKTGLGNLVVRVYEARKTAKKVSRLNTPANGTASPTYTIQEESYWEFSSMDPIPTKSTHTSVASSSNENPLGSFKVTHLKPTTDTFKYFVYIGKNDSFVRIRLYSIGEPTVTSWFVEDSLPANNLNRVHAWQEVDVKSNTTTYLTNYDREYK